MRHPKFPRSQYQGPNALYGMCCAGDAQPMMGKTVMQTAQGVPDLSTLVTALTKAGLAGNGLLHHCLDAGILHDWVGQRRSMMGQSARFRKKVYWGLFCSHSERPQPGGHRVCAHQCGVHSTGEEAQLHDRPAAELIHPQAHPAVPCCAQRRRSGVKPCQCLLCSTYVWCPRMSMSLPQP